MGERLAVRPGVFVPRQRTALLIEQTLAALRGRERPVVLEACCGVAPVAALVARRVPGRSEEHTSELQSRGHLVCRLLLVNKIRRDDDNSFLWHGFSENSS